MGMWTDIKAYKKSDEHDKHVRIWRMCQEEGVGLPPETAAYFSKLGDYIKDNPDNLCDDEVRDLLETDLQDSVRKIEGEEMVDGYEIDVAKLPKDVAIIRFANHY